MDSNVSKYTFSHKFFKLQVTKERTPISVQNLLKQELLETIGLYQLKVNFQLDLEFISAILRDKIILFQATQGQLSSKNQSQHFFSKPQSTPIIYSCSIAFVLAPYLLLEPQTIAHNLRDLLAQNQKQTLSESYLKLKVEIAPPGWINFYLDPGAIGIWLAQSLMLLKSYTTGPAATVVNNYRLEQTSGNFDNLFSVQYVHARCCSLLRLASAEKLINLIDYRDEDCFKVQSVEPLEPQCWLDQEQNLWLNLEVEYALLRMLFMAADSFAFPSNNWPKLALKLSTTVELFQAECRFLGEVRRKTPQKAIARVKLIALTQYWLQRILLEKLNVAAPRDL